MPAISEVLLNSQTHPYLNSNPITVTGDKFKGDGYYGWGDGVHTVEVELTGFVGIISIQATLAVSPSNEDWFTVPLSVVNSDVSLDEYQLDTTGKIRKINNTSQSIQYNSPTSSVTIYNFTGNFVWIRAVVSNWTAGSINRILFNH